MMIIKMTRQVREEDGVSEETAVATDDDGMKKLINYNLAKVVTFFLINV